MDLAGARTIIFAENRMVWLWAKKQVPVMEEILMDLMNNFDAHLDGRKWTKESKIIVFVGADCERIRFVKNTIMPDRIVVLANAAPDEDFREEMGFLVETLDGSDTIHAGTGEDDEDDGYGAAWQIYG
jgi:hypothetical protein